MFLLTSPATSQVKYGHVTQKFADHYRLRGVTVDDCICEVEPFRKSLFC